MNKTITIIIASVVLIFLGAMIYVKYWEKKEVDTYVNKITMCFTRNTEDGGGADMVMHITDDKVKGRFDWRPAGKDSKKGEFEGTISPVDRTMMARTLNVLWKASAEGTTSIEELKVIMGEGTATPGFGEMKRRDDGVFVYASPDKINYTYYMSLADCETEMPQGFKL